MCSTLFHAIALAMGLVVLSQGARVQRRRVNSTKLDCFSKYDGMALLHLAPCAPGEVAELALQLETLGCTLLDDDDDLGLPARGGCADVDALCSREAAASLEQRDSVSRISSDAGAHWRESSGGVKPFARGLGKASDFYSEWRDLDAQMAQVESIVAASGGIATIEVAGSSLEGRDIKIVRFTGRGYKSGDPKYLYTFNIHAREWITGMSGVYVIEQLVAKAQQDPDYLAGKEVVLMPMSNPDGFVHSTISERLHRKNMRSGTCTGNSHNGVDLNRNFDAHWAHPGGSSSDPCSQTYHGTQAMSEPETNVISKVMKESPLKVYVDVHSYSQLILSSYGYTTAQNPRHQEYRSVGFNIQTAIINTHGNVWEEGPTAQVLYVASGTTKDYADSLGALGFTFELRPARNHWSGFTPPPSEIIPAAEECFAGILATIDYPKLPSGTCVLDEDCNTNPWCNSSSYVQWCIDQGRANYCPAPYCTRL